MKFVALFVAAAIAAPAAALTFDPQADFSNASNPNGVYTYGYTTSLGGTLTNYTTGGTANSLPQSWTTPALDQFLGAYDTGSNVLLHPGPNGQFTVLRLTFTSAGSYDVIGSFSNGDNATTDVHILVNNGSVFTGAVTSSLGAAFSFTQNFAAGSTLDFVVGFGGNNYFNDSTLLSTSIASVPEPGTWALMIAGFGMVGYGARRRRGLAVTA